MNLRKQIGVIGESGIASLMLSMMKGVIEYEKN